MGMRFREVPIHDHLIGSQSQLRLGAEKSIAFVTDTYGFYRS